MPRTWTRPALTNCTACSRERARPRRTSSASSRCRRVATASVSPLDRECRAVRHAARREALHSAQCGRRLAARPARPARQPVPEGCPQALAGPRPCRSRLGHFSAATTPLGGCLRRRGLAGPSRALGISGLHVGIGQLVTSRSAGRTSRSSRRYASVLRVLGRFAGCGRADRTAACALALRQVPEYRARTPATRGAPVPSPDMATVEECEQAFHELAAKLAGADDSAKKQASLNRSVSCKLRDLNVIFFGRLKDGELTRHSPGRPPGRAGAPVNDERRPARSDIRPT